MRLAYIGVNELVSLHFVACFLPFNQEGNRDFAFLSHRWKIEQCQRDSQKDLLSDLVLEYLPDVHKFLVPPTSK